MLVGLLASVQMDVWHRDSGRLLDCWQLCAASPVQQRYAFTFSQFTWQLRLWKTWRISDILVPHSLRSFHFFSVLSSFPLSLCQYTTLSFASAEFTMNAMPKDEDRATYSTYQSKNEMKWRKSRTHATLNRMRKSETEIKCGRRDGVRALMPPQPPLIGRQKIQINE